MRDFSQAATTPLEAIAQARQIDVDLSSFKKKKSKKRRLLLLSKSSTNLRAKEYVVQKIPSMYVRCEHTQL
jgi:regulatory protein YycH of two-component signal transduction system YycFG